MNGPDKCMEDTSGWTGTYAPMGRSEVTREPLLNLFLKKFITQWHVYCEEKATHGS